MFQKVTSTMRIKELLLTHFVERGTHLQKYINMLKHLAKEETKNINGYYNHNSNLSNFDNQYASLSSHGGMTTYSAGTTQTMPR